MALIPNLSTLIKSGTTAFNTAKKGGTTADALKSASALMQGKGPIATTSSSSILSNPLKAVNNPTLDIINKATEANKAIYNPTTPSSALKNNMGPVISQPVQQVPAAVPQVDANLATQIQDLIKVMQQNNQPKAIPQYQSKYNDQIASLINQFNSRPQFAFDAINNPTIQAYQNQATDTVNQEMGRKNTLYSTIKDKRLADAIAQVFAIQAPQLEQQAYNQYQDQGQNLLQQIQNYQNLDNSDYNRFVNNYNMGNEANQNQFNNAMSIADIINKLDVQDYNKTQAEKDNARQDSQITGYLNPYPGETIDPSLSKYSGNYSQYAKDFANDNDPSNDYLIPELQKASVIKMFSDPTLLSKYGGQYKTVDQRMRDTEAELARKQAEIAANPNSYENRMKQLEYEKLAEEFNQLSTYGPKEKELGLKKIEAQIAGENASASASKASAAASYALAQQRKNNPNGTSSSKNSKYSQYLKDGLDMKTASYVTNSGNKIQKYTDKDIYNWVIGLGLDNSATSNLLNDLQIPESVVTNDVYKNARYNALGIR
jgi:hypothetical protein